MPACAVALTSRLNGEAHLFSLHDSVNRCSQSQARTKSFEATGRRLPHGSDAPRMRCIPEDDDVQLERMSGRGGERVIGPKFPAKIRFR
jgi:hypothetical protein